MIVWCLVRASRAVESNKTVGAVLDVKVSMSPHAIPWDASDVGHDRRYCIHPPPFGAQCTMHAVDAIHACASLPGCVGLVCPDPKPYWNGQPRRKITGPICQARGHLGGDGRWGGERNHLMCKPGGCAHITLRHKHLLEDGSIADAGGPRPEGAGAYASLPPPDDLPPFLRRAFYTQDRWVPDPDTPGLVKVNPGHEPEPPEPLGDAPRLGAAAPPPPRRRGRGQGGPQRPQRGQGRGHQRRPLRDGPP